MSANFFTPSLGSPGLTPEPVSAGRAVWLGQLIHASMAPGDSVEELRTLVDHASATGPDSWRAMARLLEMAVPAALARAEAVAKAEAEIEAKSVPRTSDFFPPASVAAARAMAATCQLSPEDTEKFIAKTAARVAKRDAAMREAREATARAKKEAEDKARGVAFKW